MRRLLPLSFALTAACGSPVAVDIALVDPCNQDAVATMDFLRFEPRGAGIDSVGLSTIQAVEDGATQPIELPLAEDFQLVVTGHRGSFDAPVSGIGVSARTDLVNANGDVSIQIPFALVDSFYKTTSLGDPDTCTDLQVGRFGATATFIPDHGRVLIVGGATLVARTPEVIELDYTRLVEMYDPATGTFERVGELRTGQARMFHSATYIGNGQVLVAGGEARINGNTVALVSGFVVDASDPDQIDTSPQPLELNEARTGHQATHLGGGRVLLSGGRQLVGGASRPQDHVYVAQVELFDASEGTFTFVNDDQGNSLTVQPRYGHTATRLTGEAGDPPRVMLAGGMNSNGPVLDVEVVTIDGAQGSKATAAEQLGVGAIFHAATTTDDGAVLLSGGYGRIEDAEPAGAFPTSPSASVEMWSFEAGSLRRVCTGNLVEARGFHTATAVGRRAVFVGGHGPNGDPLASAEVALLNDSGSCFAQQPNVQMMADPRTRHAVAQIESSGELLVVGGRRQETATDFGVSLSTAEIFSPAREP